MRLVRVDGKASTNDLRQALGSIFDGKSKFLGLMTGFSFDTRDGR
jgi:hypothetical protein